MAVIKRQAITSVGKDVEKGNVCVCVYSIYIYIYIYIIFKYHNLILFSYKKKEILTLATTWMDLEGIMLSEITQAENDKYCMISLRYGI